jgi:glucose/arabinose dehydrogenase
MSLLRTCAKIAGAACFMLLIAGCPDGTSGSLTFGNSPPIFTSPTTVSVVEDTSGVFYNATATDPNMDRVSFSIAGGEDAGFFNITVGGALSFATPPDFEQPADFDGNNTYRVQLAATDGFSTNTITLSVVVTDRESVAYHVRRVAAGFAAPVLLAAVPDNSGRVFVGELAGRIRILNPANGTVAAQDFLDLRGQLSTNGERGLLGFATAPDYATTGLFYVFVTDLVGTIEVRRYRRSASNPDIADPATMQVVLRQPHPRLNHNGGWIGFGDDGFLYVAIGDGGGSGDPDDNGQDTDTLLGKILRIDVARDGFPGDALRNYGIPPTNPFAVVGGAPEIWAFGLRNPFRASFYFAPTGFGPGLLIIGDVGEDTVEELDITTSGVGGDNFGWSVREGTHAFKGGDSPFFTPPAAEYLHGTGPREGDTVIGGIVYGGPVESLRGQYIFADFIRPNVWSLPVRAFYDNAGTIPSAQFTLRNADFAPDAGAFNNIVSFGEDQSRNLYLVDMDGEIFVIEAAPIGIPSRPSRAAIQTLGPRKHFCIDEWDGHTIRWSRGEMILGGEGFACVRQHYEAIGRARRGLD